MMEHTIDVPELRKQLEFVTAHPERHRQHQWIGGQGYQEGMTQEEWVCGTTACLAGWTAINAGWMPRNVWGDNVTIMIKDDEFGHPSDIAREHLGLSDAEAEALFCGDNTLSDLWHLAHEFTNGEIQVPVEFQEQDGQND